MPTTKEITTTNTPPIGNCPRGTDDLYPNGPYCYKIYYHSIIRLPNWFDAEANCQDKGGRLAVVFDDDHNKALSEAIGSDISIWIGLTKFYKGRKLQN